MQWKNEFEELEELVSALTSPALKGTPLERGTSAHSLAEQARKIINRFAFSLVKPKHRRTYIRRHQQVLVRMWDCVYDKREAVSFSLLAVSKEKSEVRGQKSERENEAKDTQRKSTPVSIADTPASGGQSLLALCECLEELHEFLMNDYADCFDVHAKVAKGYLVKAREELAKEKHGLLAALVRAKLPKKLAAVILYPFEMIIEEPETPGKRPWTYYKLGWLKEFVEVVAAESPVSQTRATSFQIPPPSGTPFNKGRDGGMYTPMVRLLVYYDFNTTKMKNWLVDAIHEDADKMKTLEKKFERLKYHHKELSKLPVREGRGYLHMLPSVKDDVCENIAKELTHLEGRQEYGVSNKEYGEKGVARQELQFLAPVHFKDGRQESSVSTSGRSTSFIKGGMANTQNNNTPESQTQESGIYFGNSVEELGLMFSVFMEVGIIRNENKTQLAEFLARHCHSIGRDQFSDTHLYNAFGHKEKKTIERLHGKLMDAVNVLRKLKVKS